MQFSSGCVLRNIIACGCHTYDYDTPGIIQLSWLLTVVLAYFT